MASPVTTQPRPKLPFAGFWIALVIVAVTAIAGIVMVAIAVGTVANAISDFAEIDVPQTAEVRLGSGEYWVFAGTPTDSSISATAVDVTVTAPDGAFVVLTSELGSYDAETGGLSFTSLGRIDVQSAGVYTFETNGPGEATVRVGQLPLGRFVGLLVGGIVVGGLGFLLALILVIVTLVRRSSAKKRLAASAYPVAGGPTPFAAPTPPPFSPPPRPRRLPSGVRLRRRLRPRRRPPLLLRRLRLRRRLRPRRRPPRLLRRLRLRRRLRRAAAPRARRSAGAARRAARRSCSAGSGSGARLRPRRRPTAPCSAARSGNGSAVTTR